MKKTSVQSIIQTAIISAFTIATALIWKDVITGFIDVVLPHQSALLYKFIAAILATMMVVIAIMVILRTETEAEVVIKKIKKNNHR